MVSESQNTILPIIVLYNVPLAESSTYRSLCVSLANFGVNKPAIAVYDNSPVPQVTEAEAQQLLAYKHDSSNSGLAAAYNWALEETRPLAIGWLLLLDQDSTLQPDFFASATREAEHYGPDSTVVAIVPIIRSGGLVVSPKRVKLSGFRKIPATNPGIQNAEIMAINSGATIRCSFLDLIGGFDRGYWIDFLDHWIFAQIYSRGFYAAVTKALVVHDLSAQRPHAYSTQRYKSILLGERRFVRSEKPPGFVILYHLQLFLRAIRQLIQYRRPDLSIITLQSMGHRM